MHWLTSTASAIHVQIKQMQKIYCWKRCLVMLKVCMNRDNQTWWVKQLNRASSFKMQLFLFSLVSQSYSHLWALMVCNTWWHSAKYFWASWKIHLRTKNPGHSLTDCMCYLNSDSITLWCYSGDAVPSQGGQNTSLAPSHGHGFKGKVVTKQGEDRDSSCSSAGSVHICEPVSTESLKYFTIASSVSCMAKKDKKLTLVQTYRGQTDKSFFWLCKTSTCEPGQGEQGNHLHVHWWRPLSVCR